MNCPLFLLYTYCLLISTHYHYYQVTLYYHFNFYLWSKQSYLFSYLIEILMTPYFYFCSPDDLELKGYYLIVSCYSSKHFCKNSALLISFFHQRYLHLYNLILSQNSGSLEIYLCCSSWLSFWRSILNHLQYFRSHPVFSLRSQISYSFYPFLFIVKTLVLLLQTSICSYQVQHLKNLCLVMRLRILLLQ